MSDSARVALLPTADEAGRHDDVEPTSWKPIAPIEPPAAGELRLHPAAAREERFADEYLEAVVSQRFSEESELLVVILHQWRRGKQLIYRRCLEHRQAQDL